MRRVAQNWHSSRRVGARKEALEVARQIRAKLVLGQDALPERKGVSNPWGVLRAHQADIPADSDQEAHTAKLRDQL